MLVRRPLRDERGDGRWLLVIAFLFTIAGLVGVGAIMWGRAQGFGL